MRTRQGPKPKQFGVRKLAICETVGIAYLLNGFDSTGHSLDQLCVLAFLYVSAEHELELFPIFYNHAAMSNV